MCGKHTACTTAVVAPRFLSFLAVHGKPLFFYRHALHEDLPWLDDWVLARARNASPPS